MVTQRVKVYSLPTPPVELKEVEAINYNKRQIL